MIIAISHAGDEHAAPVLEALRRAGAKAALVDVSAFPRRAVATFEHGAGARATTLRGPWGAIRASDVTAVWWRRPIPFEIDPALASADAEFAFRQVKEALAGFAASLATQWVNDPWREAAASHKTYQLAVAERVGLTVPRTLVTSDPARARAFLGARKGTRVIHKALHATAEDWRPTRLVGPEDLARLDALRFAPVVLQEYVAGVDVRVTAVGGKLFAAAIDARRTSSPEDFRPVVDDARVEPCKLPGAVATRIRKLLRELGLSYAAIDLRRSDDGEHVFLEANPSGQWLFVERRTGLPITEAVARLLAGR